MFLKTAIAALLSALLLPTYAAGDAFKLKGRSIGDAPHEACGSSDLKSHQKLLDETGVTGFTFPAEGCDIEIDSIAGLQAANPAILLFWKGKLIRMVVKTDYLDMQSSWRLIGDFVDLYGKPKIERSKPFRTYYWRKLGQELTIEQLETYPSTSGIYLTDTRGWSEYEKERDRADKAVKELAKKERLRNINN